ncbi:MAG: UvrD-helicase domain-containing protein [Hydrogenophaga sp.]|uniref:UvrD-helicase domain-containing protein n=1 Tax=Hydrogenophaga sp. TaxID=1904254 RepID=UPI00257BB49B|nr:UvrD-helicase domain-containing protein [Hydrogenophaga sp.]MBL0945753.1 UvrD-helicase domain-containing protein [Hydrogenophaga sp.]
MSSSPRALAYRIDGREVPPEAFYARACDPVRSVAVEACAGAGKTWMLVSRILRALLAGAEPQDILAITFTKKAAGEMRERLQQELAAWARLDDAALHAALCQRGLGEAEARALLPAARGLQARVRAHGRPVQLRTFHGWFAALLRAAPLSLLQSLGLPPSYELQEDDAPLIQRSWPGFFAAVAQDAALQADFFASVADIGRHATLQALKTAAHKRVEFALADAAGVVDGSVEPFAARHPQWAGLERPALSLLTPAARERWHGWARALGAESAATPRKAADAVVDAFLLPDEPAQAAARLARLRKAFLVKDEDRLTRHLQKFAAAEAAEAELQALCAAERQHAAWQHHQRMARLTRVLLHSLAALKRERGWVDMNDVEGAARRLLGDAELSGWLQQRLDARVRHLLIDEFQDTNPLQWQALYGWLSAYAGAGVGEAPSVFLVGDPKQSIYRFRRAEPQVFRAAQAFVVQGLGGALLACDHTRRCAVAVVDAVNEVMQRAVADGEYGEAVGAAFRPHTTGSDTAGSVLALPAVPRSARVRAEADTSAWRDSLLVPRHPPEDAMSALEARQAADWIAAQIAAGELRAEQVMVLARKRERLGWMHEALRERGIASDEPEKTDLADAAAVQDLIALVDALVSPGHDLSLARALRSPIGGWTDDDLVRLAEQVQADGSGAGWWPVLQAQCARADAPAHWRETAQRWAGWQQVLRALPPHDALTRIVREGDLMARYVQAAPAPQRAAVLAQLQALLALSLQHEGGRFLTAYRLVRAVKAGGLTLAPVAVPGAVRLLTIHGAKGLEAHTVLLLDTQAPPSRPESQGVLIDWPGEAAQPRRFVFLLSEKLAPRCAQDLLDTERRARSLEELNTLYVAMTRAATRLVVSAFEPHQSATQPSWWQRLAPLAQALEAPAPAAARQDGPAEPWRLDSLPTLSATPEPLADDSAADDPNARWGEAVHRLLQWHPTPAAGFDWTAAHQRAVERDFELDARRAAEALAAARRIVQGAAAWVWDPQAIDHWGNEVDLVHEGRALRMDRLVRERASGAWWVIDFKSADNPHRVPEYQQQLRDYRAALQAARPGEPVRLAFITAQGRFIELDAPA